MSVCSDQFYDILEAVKNYLSINENDRTAGADGRLLHLEGPGSVADVLSKFGIEVNATNDRGDTLLTIALRMNESVKVIRGLLALGANVKTKNIYLRTPLHCLFLSEEPDMETVKVLLHYKADVNAKDYYLQTPLHLILKHYICRGELVELILKHGADVTAVDYENSTPLLAYLLYHSNEEHDVNIVRLLLHYKADVNAKNRDLQTPLHLIFDNSNCKSEVLEFLLKYGADVKAKNFENFTPIDKALNCNNVIGTKIIISYILFKRYDGDWRNIVDIERSVNNDYYGEVVAYINKCLGEIDEMKGHKVNDKFSLYDWNRFATRSLIPKPLYTTETFSEVEISKRYPEYGSTLSAVIGPCLYRADLFNQLEELQYTEVCSKLGIDCMRKIVEYVSNNDLFNFISALSKSVPV